MSRYENFLKAANVVALLAYFVVASFNPMHKKEDGHEGNDDEGHIIKYGSDYPHSHLSPAIHTFGIWIVIYSLLVGFIIYQWFEAAHDATVDGVQYYHVLNCILTSAWLVIWARGYYLLDFFVSLALLISLSKIFSNLQFYPPKNLADRLFIHYPFTIFAGWVFVASFFNFWIAVRSLNTVPLSTGAIIIIGLIGLYFIDYHPRHDVVLATTIVWILIGIAVKQYEVLPVLIASIVSSTLISGGILRSWGRDIAAWRAMRNRRLNDLLDETSPLVNP